MARNPRWWILTVVLAVVAGPLIGLLPSANAGAGLSVAVELATPSTVGDMNLLGAYTIRNGNNTVDTLFPIVIDTMTLIPSCGTTAGVGSGTCPPGFEDPDVFDLISPQFRPGSAPVGEGACAGRTFTIVEIDAATGEVAFVPDMPIVLQGVGDPNDNCTINFFFDVLKTPTIDALPGEPGADTAQIGMATGNTVPPPGSIVPVKPAVGGGASFAKVLAADVGSIVTVATSAPLGTPITDSATVTGVVNGPVPTGTIVFTLFGPAADPAIPTCTALVFTSPPQPLTPGPVPPPGSPPTATATLAPGFAPTQPGTYFWIASYSGDVNYAPAVTACGDAGETSVVTGATIVTIAQTPVTIGSTVRDVATVTGTPGQPAPTGTVTFTLFGPAADPAVPVCTGTPIFTSANRPLGGGPPPMATSADFAPPAPGTYFWVATYSGDALYPPVISPCGADGETSVVTQATPAITTQATATARIGEPIRDVATVTGTPPSAPPPTGTVTFTVFGPAVDPAVPVCTGAPIFTSTNRPLGGGPPPTATSADFLPAAPGAYFWVAAYSGDANYPSITSPCGAAGETSLVTLATIATTALTPVTVGSPIRDVAVVTGSPGAPAPTGTVTFTLFGPAADPAVPVCTGTPIFTSADRPLGGGPPPTATSADFAPIAPGTYFWVATYNGDPNYAAVTSPCGAAGETSVVTQAPVAIATMAVTPVSLGNPIRDVATVTGGVSPAPAPTGTVTFTLFGPAADPAVPVCTGTPIFTSANRPLGGGPPPTATSADFTPTAIGTYFWVAVYSGDANYPSVASPCGAPNEASVVTPPAATIVTSALTPVTVGSPIRDVATVSGPQGAPAPTGTVTFTLFGPAADPAVPVCTGTPIFTSADRPLGGGPPPTATSADFVPPGPGSYFWVATYNGDLNYAAVTSPCGAAGETSVVTSAPIAIATTAVPVATLGSPIRDVATVTGGVPPAPAPTGTVTFTLFGPAADPAVPVCTGTPIFTSANRPLGGGPPPTATSADFVPLTAGTYFWVAVYSGDANYPSATSPCGAANETSRVLPAPSITIVKTAVPPSRVEPGGDFTFNFVITNTGPEALTITSLVDDVYGPLAPRGNCDFIGDVLQPGASFTCEFTVPFVNKNAGDFQIDNVVVTAVNSRNDTVTATDSARIDITPLPPFIEVVKDPVPLSRVEPGGNFTYTITVTNPGTLEAVTITSLTDDKYGDLSTKGTCTNAIGTVLAVSPGPGNTYTCQFTEAFMGVGGDSKTNIVTVIARDDDLPNPTFVTDSDPATITITPLGGPPTVVITKTPSPASRPEPGGQFTFNFVVTNTSADETVTITSLLDDVYGNLNGQGTCAIGAVLAPGATYSCAFTVVFNGNAGATQRDVVTVRVIDDDGQQAVDDDDAIITITDVPPVITVVKTATPLVRNEPGGTFTFDVLITNTGPETVTIDTLSDDVYGNLNGRGSCAVGAVLPPGGTYRCSFTGEFVGNAGASQTDIVTASGVDNDGSRTTARDDAVVRLVDVPPTVTVVKEADPVSRPEPGGSFTFTFVVTNTSFEPVTIVSLTDDVYGNLAGRGTCAVGAVLPPGGVYRCQFSVEYRGVAGATQVDRVIVTVVDNDGTRASATDDARISLTPVGTPPAAQQLSRTGGDVGGPATLAFGLLLLGLLMVGATMRSRRAGGLAFAGPGATTAWFTGLPSGGALRGVVDGLRTSGRWGRSSGTPDSDLGPHPHLGFEDLGPDDLGPDDLGPDEPPDGGPTAGGRPPSGRGPSGGGSGAAAPIEDLVDTDWQAPSPAPPAGGSPSAPTESEWNAVISRPAPTVGEAAAMGPAVPEPDAPFDISLLPPPAFPTPPKKDIRITRLI